MSTKPQLNETLKARDGNQHHGSGKVDDPATFQQAWLKLHHYFTQKRFQNGKFLFKYELLNEPFGYGAPAITFGFAVFFRGIVESLGQILCSTGFQGCSEVWCPDSLLLVFRPTKRVNLVRGEAKLILRPGCQKWWPKMRRRDSLLKTSTR